ncbi:four-carbon acid sugar kinase family protein [Agrococcus citreus]|uniref:3-oxo-tetronate kinase n=2 Tax=Agrococcus citreus TaxID=84643 RepID=A0ABN1YUD7_9MICO
MQLGVIADDYTGATDLAGMLARLGLSAVQHLGVPDEPDTSGADVVVVALKSRSIPASDAVAQSVAAARWLLEQGAPQLFFKYCSTFDSTDRGNIGPVAVALADLVDAESVVFAPSVPENGRTVYRSHLFVHDQLLSESPLRDHPINPMRDADLRRVLRAQVDEPVAAVHLDVVAQGATAVRDALTAAADAGTRFVIADAVDDADLVTWGAALTDARLVTGGAGLAVGMARASLLTADAASRAFTVPAGPAAVLSGSCSAATRRQVAHHRDSHPSFELDVRALAEGDVPIDEAIAFLRSHVDERPLVYSSSDPDVVAQIQADLGVDASAALVERAFGRIAAAAVDAGVRQIVVAGGETSGAVVNGLGVRSLAIGPEVDPGVPWTSSGGEVPVALLLKSGNFGQDDIFTRALDTAPIGDTR